MILPSTSPKSCSTSCCFNLSSLATWFSISLKLHVICNIGSVVKLFCLLPLSSCLVYHSELLFKLKTKFEVTSLENLPCIQFSSIVLLWSLSNYVTFFQKWYLSSCTLLSVSAVCRLIPTKLKHREIKNSDKNQLHEAFSELGSDHLRTTNG